MKPRRHARERWSKPWFHYFGPNTRVRLRHGRWWVWHIPPTEPIITDFRIHWGVPAEGYSFTWEASNGS